MITKLIVAPVEEPVSLAEAQAQCRTDDPSDDDLIRGLISAAREQAEHEISRPICMQTRELVLDSFDVARKPLAAPLQLVESIKYLDAQGNQQTLPATEYRVDTDSEPGTVVPAYGKSWPATYPVPSAVRIRYICGYGGADDVPVAIKRWILVVVSTLYNQRESISAGQVASLPARTIDRLLDPCRLYGGA